VCDGQTDRQTPYDGKNRAMQSVTRVKTYSENCVGAYTVRNSFRRRCSQVMFCIYRGRYSSVPAEMHYALRLRR